LAVAAKNRGPVRAPMCRLDPPQRAPLPDVGIVVRDRMIPPDTRLAGSVPCLLRPELAETKHLALDLRALIRGFWTTAASSLSSCSASRRPKSARARSRGQPGRRLGVERYGDFRVTAHSLEAGHRGEATRMPACGSGRGSGRSVPAGSEGYRRAPSGWIARNRVERDRRRRGASARER
jgi:hypothetical protein